MSFFRIPLDNQVPWYQFPVSLEGVSYTFEAYYNTRADAWRLNIRDALGSPLLTSIPLTIDRDLLGPYHYLAIPPGLLLVVDDSGNDLEAGLASFVTDHSLYYLESTG